MINMTDSEKRALIVFVSVIVISVVIQWFLPHKTRMDVYDYSLEDSLFEAVSKGRTTKLIPETSDNKDKAEWKTSEKVMTKTDHLVEKSIDINKATYEQLTRLPRIGKVTATGILNYRNTHGPFKSLQDLTKVKRIGPKTLEKISPYIYIQVDTTMK
jgi:competence ComEA-like helix-hairpin-helix protein